MCLDLGSAAALELTTIPYLDVFSASGICVQALLRRQKPALMEGSERMLFLIPGWLSDFCT